MDDVDLAAEIPGKKHLGFFSERLKGECRPEKAALDERPSLQLQRVRLGPSERWTSWNSGLCFLFTEAGSGVWTSNNSSRSLCAGELLVQGCGQSGELQAAERSGVSCAFFSVSAESIFPLFSNHEIPCLLSIISQFNRPRVYAASDSLTRNCGELLKQTPATPRLAQRIRLLQVVATLLGPQFEAGPISSSGSCGKRAEEQLVRLLERVSANELLTLSVSELSAKFKCSRRHLNRLFNEHFGISIATLKMEMRLLKAASLLRHPDAKIIHVAEQCGFHHLGLFNTCFKRRFGSTPGRWRKLGLPPSAPRLKAESTPICALRANGLCSGMLEDIRKSVAPGRTEDNCGRCESSSRS